MNKIIKIASICLLSFSASQLYAHGYVQDPNSRAAFCSTQNGTNKNCGAIQYEPQSIEAATADFDNGKLDGNLGSGGRRSDFKELDEVMFKDKEAQQNNEGRWARTTVKPNSKLQLTWTFSAEHNTKDFLFYITKQGFDPKKALTRADFEKDPLNCDPKWEFGEKPHGDTTFTCQLPDRSGYQVIMAKWEVSNTPDSFYNLIDVEFDPNKKEGTVIKPYNGGDVTKNKLDISGFNDNYKINSDGSIDINAKIKSESTETVNVTIDLLDENNIEKNILDTQIEGGASYDFNKNIAGLHTGKYRLVITSKLEGTQPWQKTLNIEVSDSGPKPDPHGDHDVDVTLTASTPYYQVNQDNTVLGRDTNPAHIGEIKLGKHQVTVAPWNTPYDSSSHVKCPLPSDKSTSVTYFVSGNFDNVSCEIKK